MLKKEISYVDYDGNKRKENHYFNMNKSEIIKWLTTTGEYTLDKVVVKLSKEKNGKEIMRIFEDLIRTSYGRKSLDGRKFEKSQEIWEDFYQTEAYSELFYDLVTDAKKGAEFVNGIIPKELADEIQNEFLSHPEGIPDELRDYIPPLTPMA